MRRPKNPDAYRGAHPFGRPVVVIEMVALPLSSIPGAQHPSVTSLDEWAAKAPKKKKGLRPAGRQDVEISLIEADEMRERNNFKGARPRHFVALYALFHKHVYGVHPGELAGKAWTAACLMVARILEREFGGDVERFVSFIAWSWRREKRAHARATDDRRRMGWRLQFSPSLVTDYRVALASDGKRTG